MKIMKLSRRMTEHLELVIGAGMLDVDAVIPYHRGPGTFTYCLHCYHSRTEDGNTVCGHPSVDTGLQGCFFAGK